MIEYVINLSNTRWVKRALAWDPVGTHVPWNTEFWGHQLGKLRTVKRLRDRKVTEKRKSSVWSSFRHECVNFRFPAGNERETD